MLIASELVQSLKYNFKALLLFPGMSPGRVSVKSELGRVNVMDIECPT